MAIACDFLYSVRLSRDSDGSSGSAASASLGGRCVEVSPRKDRGVAPALGSRPTLRLAPSGLTLHTDPEERPRFWHFGQARLKHPFAASALCAEAGPLAAMAQEDDEVEFGLGQSGELGLVLLRKGLLEVAVGSPRVLQDCSFEPHVRVEPHARISLLADREILLTEGQETTAGSYVIRLRNGIDKSMMRILSMSIVRKGSAPPVLVDALVDRFAAAELVTTRW